MSNRIVTKKGKVTKSNRNKEQLNYKIACYIILLVVFVLYSLLYNIKKAAERQEKIFTT